MDRIVIDAKGRVSESKGKGGSQCHYGFDPVDLTAGLMKPQAGFTPATGRKNWGRGNALLI